MLVLLEYIVANSLSGIRRRVEGHEDPFAAVDRKEHDQVEWAVACADSAALDVFVESIDSARQDTLIRSFRPSGGAGEIHAVAAQASQAALAVGNPTWRWTLCLLALVVYAVVACPSSFGSSQTAGDHRRCWKRRHRAARKRRPVLGWADGHSRGLAGPDTVPCRVSSPRWQRAVCRASAPPHGSLPCPLGTTSERESGRRTASSEHSRSVEA